MKTKDKATPPTNWTEWIKSEEGKRCANVGTLVAVMSQKDRELYLENRLWAAFVAGAQYERDKVAREGHK